MTTINFDGFKNTNSKILIECDIKSSHKCKGVYSKTYRFVLKSRNKNAGKDICTFCYNKTVNIGSKNGAFIHKKNDTFFENIDDELKAYLLGLIAGDGSIDKSGKRFTLYANKNDGETLELLKFAICPTLKIFNDNGCCCVKVNSTKMVLDLCKHLKINTGKKCDKISLPDLSKDLIWHFIRGLIDSDGNISDPSKGCTTPRCKITSFSYEIKQQIKTICDSLNINNYINDHDIQFTGKYAIAFMDLIYNNSNYSLSRKRNYYKIWKTWKSNRGNCIRPRKNSRASSTTNIISNKE